MGHAATRHDPFLFLRFALVIPCFIGSHAAASRSAPSPRPLLTSRSWAPRSIFRRPAADRRRGYRDPRRQDRRNRRSAGRSRVPKSAQVIDCAGKVITEVSGTAMCTSPKACGQCRSRVPQTSSDQHMQEMLTRWGFTTVWDIGSNPIRHDRPAQARRQRRSCGSEDLHHCRQHPPGERNSGVRPEGYCRAVQAV